MTFGDIEIIISYKTLLICTLLVTSYFNQARSIYSRESVIPIIIIISSSSSSSSSSSIIINIIMYTSRPVVQRSPTPIIRYPFSPAHSFNIKAVKVRKQWRFCRQASSSTKPNEVSCGVKKLSLELE